MSGAAAQRLDASRGPSLCCAAPCHAGAPAPPAPCLARGLATQAGSGPRGTVALRAGGFIGTWGGGGGDDIPRLTGHHSADTALRPCNTVGRSWDGRCGGRRALCSLTSAGSGQDRATRLFPHPAGRPSPALHRHSGHRYSARLRSVVAASTQPERPSVCLPTCDVTALRQPGCAERSGALRERVRSKTRRPPQAGLREPLPGRRHHRNALGGGHRGGGGRDLLGGEGYSNRPDKLGLTIASSRIPYSSARISEV